MKIAIVTDSTAVISEELKKNPNLFILKVPVIIDGEPKTDEDISAEEFYHKLSADKKQGLPTTSQPSMGEVMELYNQIAAKGYDQIISIHLSSGISGFINHLKQLVPTIENIQVFPFDSLLTSAPMYDMVETALRLIDKGATVEEILSVLEEMRTEQRAYLVVDDLYHLVRGGRLSNGAALIGSLLKIKPVLRFDEEGKIVVFEKIRSSKKAYKRGIELCVQRYHELKGKAHITIVHTDYESQALDLASKISAEIGEPVKVNDLGIVVGTHVGAKAIGFAITEKIEG